MCAAPGPGPAPASTSARLTPVHSAVEMVAGPPRPRPRRGPTVITPAPPVGPPPWGPDVGSSRRAVGGGAGRRFVHHLFRPGKEGAPRPRSRGRACSRYPAPHPPAPERPPLPERRERIVSTTVPESSDPDRG